MKFIARKGAPDIPLELIEAQESGDLVFFCGAGVSFPSGLPGFAELVDNIYKELPAAKSELEEQAIKAGLYDRALGLLESRIEENNSTGINHVRLSIISQLSLPQTANVDVHKAILQLSRTKKENYRLVTTNVDCGFQLADKTIRHMTDAAPRLPVPKPHKWQSVVHLHGIINKKQDPNGEHLIFTSGDFGSAYLTERWASKFVTELFLNFTVLFVGYSLNDPVIRYMTDAIAADRRRGSGQFTMPYVIAEAPPSKINKIKNEWAAKGVVPVLYSKGGKSHPNLHNTLKAWAAHSRDGLNSKRRIIRLKGRLKPIPPYDKDESVKQVLDTLKERKNKNHHQITGDPAKVFCELEPPAPIEWLPVFHQEGLFSIGNVTNKVTVVNQNPIFANLASPNKISINLWHWLLSHLENGYLIRWVIDQGVCLHPEFNDMVKRKIAAQPINEPYLSFWQIVTSTRICCGSASHSIGYEEVQKIIGKSNKLDLFAFRHLLRSSYKISKSFYWGDNDKYKATKPYDVEVVIGINNWAFKKLVKSELYPTKFTGLIDTVTGALFEVLELQAFIKQASAKSDRSNWDIVSIEPHQQNSHFRNWVILVELCRDLWGALFDINMAKAKSILHIWKSYKYPIFRRLVLHSFTVRNVVSQYDALNYLLEDDGLWLWSVSTRREVFRLLNKIWPQMKQSAAQRLLKLINIGPKREFYPRELTDERFELRLDRERWLFLAKLESFGREPFGSSGELFRRIKLQYPQWALKENGRDEFSHWHSSSSGNETDITQDELFSLSVRERVIKLTEKSEKLRDGRIDTFRFSGKAHTLKVIETLELMHAESRWDEQVWHAGLTGIAESEEDSWSKMARLVSKLPNELYKNEAWAIAWWARKSVSAIEAKADSEKYLWSIVKKLISESVEENLAPEETEGAVNRAINDPIGIIVEAILDRLGLYSLSAEEGLPSPEPLEIINSVVNEKGNSLVSGRVILLSRLMYFYSVAPEWTQRNLIPLLDFDKNEGARLYWQGYLWNPRVSADLAIDLKEHILRALENVEYLTDESAGLIKLFTFICLQYTDMYRNNEIQRVFAIIENERLADVAEFLLNAISNDVDGSDNYWQYRIKPFVKKAWPKDGRYLNARASEKLALLVLQLEDRFIDGVNAIKPMLRPANNNFAILDRFTNTNVIEHYPDEAFDLLQRVLCYKNNLDNDLLKALMRRFEKVKPSLSAKPEFLKMLDFLLLNE